MFRKLKDRIAEEVRQSPIKLPATVQSFGQNVDEQEAPQSSGESIQQQLGVQGDNDVTKESDQKEEAQDLISLSENSNSLPAHTSTSNSDKFSIDEDDTSGTSESPAKAQNFDEVKLLRSSTPIKKEEPMHDAALLPMYSSPNSSYNLQSDIESTHSEFEDSFQFKNRQAPVDVDKVVYAFGKLKNRLLKYKGKYTEVVQAYKELHHENNKIKQVLSESQDKALRRISELREQSQLEQKAKVHLEENLRVSLEEKDQLISVLQTQVRLLKDGGSLENLNDSNVLVDINEDPPQQADSDELVNLREKVKRLETLLTKCKDTIKSHKERNQNLTKDKEQVSKELEEKILEFKSFQESSDKNMNEMRTELNNVKERLNRMLKQEEEGALGMAETKRRMYEELESKENLIKELKHKEAVLLDEKQNWRRTETALEDEKQNLVQELSRGKAAAINLMKQEEAKKITILKKEYEEKCNSLRKENDQHIAEKEKELEQQMKKYKESMLADLQEKEKEMELAIEERDLQKMAALSQQDSRADELNVEIQNLKTHELELQSSNETLKQDFAIERQNWIKQLEDNHTRHVEENNKVAEEHKNEVEELKSQFKREMEDKIERLHIDHNNEMEILKKKNDDALQNASSELEKGLQDQLELLKLGHQQSSEESLVKISQLETTIGEYKANLELKVQALEDLEAKLKEMQNSEAKLSDEIIESNDKHRALLSKVKCLEDELKIQVQENVDLEQKVRELNDLEIKLKEVQSSETKLRAELMEKNAENLSLLSKSGSLEDNMQKNAEEIETKFKTLLEKEQELCSQIENYKIKLKSIEDEVLEGKSLYEKANEEKAASEERAHSVQKLYDELTKDFDDIKKEYNRLSSDNEVLRSDVESLKTSSEKKSVEILNELEETREKFKVSQEENNALKTSIQNLEAELSQNSEKLIECNHQFDQVSKDTVELQNSNSDLQEQLTSALEIHSQSVEENKILQEKIDHTKTDYEAQIQTLNDQFSSDLNRMSSDSDAIGAELKTLNGKLLGNQTEHDEMVKKLNEELSIKDEMLNSIEKERENFKLQNVDLTKNLEANLEHSTKLENELMQLQSKLSELNNQLDEKMKADDVTLLTIEQKDFLVMQQEERIKNLIDQHQTNIEEVTNQLRSSHCDEMIHLRKIARTSLQLLNNEEVSVGNGVMSPNESISEEFDSLRDVLCNLLAKVEEAKAHRSSLAEELDQSAKNAMNFSEKCQELETEVKSLTEKHVLELDTVKSQQTKDNNEKLQALKVKVKEKMQSVDQKHREQLEIVHEQLESLKAEKQEVEVIVESLKEKLERTLSELEELGEQNQSFQSEIQSKEELLDNNAHSLHELKDEILNLQHINSSLNAQLEALNNKNDKNEEELTSKYDEKLQTRQAEYEQNVAVMKRSMEQLEMRVELVDELQTKLENSEKVLEESNMMHRENIENVEALHRDKQEQLVREHDAAIAKLKEQIQQLEQELSENGEQSANTQSQSDEIISQLKSDHRSLEEKLMHSNEEIEKLQETTSSQSEQLVILKEKESEIQRLEDQLRSIQEDKVQLLSKLGDGDKLMNERIAEADQKITEISKEANITREKLQQMSQFEEKCSDLVLNCSGLEVKLNSANEELTSVKNDLTSSEQRLQESETKVKKVTEESQTKLQDLKKRAEIRLSKIKKQLQSEKEKEIQKLQNVIDAHKKEISEKEEARKSEVSKLNSKIQTETETHRMKLEEIQDELKDVRQQLNISLDESEQEKERYNELEISYKLTCDKKVRLEKELKNLKEAHTLAYGSSAIEEQHQAELDALREENTIKLDQMDLEHQRKLKLIIKEFTQRIEQKDQEYEVMLTQAISKGSQDETVMVQEHDKEIRELYSEIDEKNKAMEEIREYYHGIIQENKEQFNAQILKFEEEVKEAESAKAHVESEKTKEIDEMLEKVQALEKDKSSLITEHMEEMAEIEFKYQQDLKRELEDVDAKYKERIAKMTQATQIDNGDGRFYELDINETDAANQTLEKQSQLAMSVLESGTESAELLRRKIISQSQEIDELKSKYQTEVKELKESYEKRDDSTLNSKNAHNNSLDASNSNLPQYTEIEYLKNIVYEYLMGKETMTMIKVISAVLKFSDDQTKRIIEREEARQSLVSQLIGS